MKQIKMVMFLKKRYLYNFIKRIFDIIFGIIGCILLVPITLYVYILHLIYKDKGNIFYTQKRIGKNNKVFKMYKFKTMVDNADEELEKVLSNNYKMYNEYKKYKKLQNDPRLTKVGRIIRNFSIDEFPQFINVIKGEMSVIGNRPYLISEKKYMKNYIHDIVSTKPGITGLWQTFGRNNITFNDRLKIEQKYSKECNLLIDIEIFLKTFIVILKDRNPNHDKKINVLMIGTSRRTKGGITTVVNSYYKAGLDKKINLKYIETVNDGNKLSKILKMIKGFFQFIFNVKNYDIVHIHMSSRYSTWRKSIYINISKLINKKIILHMHGSEFDIFYKEECNDFQKKYIKKMFNKANTIIALTEEWKIFLSHITDKKKIVVIKNSIQVPSNFNKNINNKNILFLGIIGKRKGLYDLIEVIKKLKKKYKDIHLYIGGNGEVKKLLELMKSNNLQNNITYLGWLNEEQKIKYLKKCTYYILPSYNEGQPLSVLEAMGYKCVTISTNINGIKEIITSKKDGILIDPGDTKKLYDEIVELINTKELRKKYSNNGYNKILKEFNIETTINELLKLYMR